MQPSSLGEKPPPASPGASHLVQFYESDELLGEVVARYLGAGVAAGEPLVAFATAAHRQDWARRLAAIGVDLRAAMAAGTLTLLDARATLGGFLIDGRPDWTRFQSLVGGVLERARAAGQGRRVRVFSEMVDLLWQDGHAEAAVQLEELWNRLARTVPFGLLCAYMMGSFYKQAHGDEFERICFLHDQVLAGEDAPAGQPDEAREISLLQERARALETEIEHRKDLEQALRASLGERARLYAAERGARRAAEAAQARAAFLSEATAILASSLDYEETLAAVARLSTQKLAEACLIELAPDVVEPVLPLIATHADPAKVDLVRRFPTARLADRGVGDVIRTGRSELHPDFSGESLAASGLESESLDFVRALGARSAIFVPMSARGRTLGAITLVSSDLERRFDQADLATAEHLAQRAALAVDNARLYREAREADRRKDEFLALLGHELRNPLAPILTALQLMQLKGIGGERERALIERQVRHLSRLVDDLLDVSRITRGKITLKKERVEIAEVVAKALETASPLYEQRRHGITVSVPRQGLAVAGDVMRLEQVIGNLLTNAAKFTEPGGHVWIRGEREGGEVFLRIRDNGVGIEPEVLPHIFAMFVQGDRRRDQSKGGLGLGLALVESLVRLHDGAVTATSLGRGRGSEFVVRLPAAAAVPLQVDAQETSGLHLVDSVLRVLVVDDNDDAAEMIAESLQSVGHEAQVAHDGPAALAVAAVFEPDVAILDIGLPVMDGYELAERLRDLPGRAGLRLIALTGFGQESDRARALEAGFHEHFVKPVDIDQLASALRPVRRRRHARRVS